MIPARQQLLPRLSTACPPLPAVSEGRTGAGIFTDRHRHFNAGPGVGSYAELARKHGLTRTQLEVGLAYCRLCVGNTAMGAATEEQLRKNLAAAPVVLSPELLAEVGRIRRQQAHGPL